MSRDEADQEPVRQSERSELSRRTAEKLINSDAIGVIVHLKTMKCENKVLQERNLCMMVSRNLGLAAHLKPF